MGCGEHCTLDTFVDFGSMYIICLFTLCASPLILFVVALWNRADHYIFMLLCVLLSSFFPRLISATPDWMSAILPHMVWP